MISEIRRTRERTISGRASDDDWRSACYDSVTMFTTPNATSKERSLCGLCNMDSNEYQVWVYPMLDIPQLAIIGNGRMYPKLGTGTWIRTTI